MPGPRSVLLLTADDGLAERVATLAAAGGVVLDRLTVPPGPHAAVWRDRPLVVLGADALDPSGPAYPGDLRLRVERGSVVVVAPPPADGVLWRRAVEIGADQVALLPEAEAWLLDRLLDAAAGPARGRVLGVIGGRGGAGASTLAVTLALTGARRRLTTLLVDADPNGGGLDLLLGAQALPGLRWRDIAGLRGRLQPGLLTGSCVDVDGIRLLSWGDGPADESCGAAPGPGTAEAMAAVLDAAAREADLVVVDLPRSVGPAETVALGHCHRVFLVVPAEVRAASAAAGLARVVADLTGDLRLVVRGPAPSGLPADTLADLLFLPLAAALPPEPGLAGALDRGEAAAVRPRGALGRFAARVVGEVVVELATADPRPGPS